MQKRTSWSSLANQSLLPEQGLPHGSASLAVCCVLCAVTVTLTVRFVLGGHGHARGAHDLFFLCLLNRNSTFKMNKNLIDVDVYFRMFN